MKVALCETYVRLSLEGQSTLMQRLHALWGGLVTMEELARKFHTVPGTGCVVITGAGISAISALFAEHGASRTILEVQVPYTQKALDEFVGTQADQHVSESEAILIAESAQKRARYLAPDNLNQSLFGVGCTAAIATDRIRKGEDRAHIAWSDVRQTGGVSVWFDKEARTRADEEKIVAAIVMNSIAAVLKIDDRLEISILETERIDEFG